MAEVMLRQRVDDLGLDVRVASAGRLESGLPASDHGIEVLRGRGIDMVPHRSRRSTKDILLGADLVLGMAREHVMDAVVAVPALFPRTFTLRELVRRGEAAGPRRQGESLDGWLARVGEGRTHRDVLGASRDDDIADPIGGPRSAYERLAVELDGLLDRLVAVAFAGALTAR